VNKKVVWIIVVVILALLAVFFMANKNNSENNNDSGLEINSGEYSVRTLQDEGDAGLATPDDDFAEIDEALNYIE